MTAVAANVAVNPAAHATAIAFCAKRRMPICLVTRCQPLSKDLALLKNQENRAKLQPEP
jgi:DNA repair photolyase